MASEKLYSLLAALTLDENPLVNQFMYVEELSNADGSFVLSLLIKEQIKRNCNIILVLCHNSFGHFHSISQKLDYNLISLRSSGEVFVIDILEKIMNENFLNSKEPLEELYKCIKQQISDWGDEKGVCVILENIGNLMLVDLKEVFPFINYIRSIALSVKNSSAICSIHNFPDSPKVGQLTQSIRHFADLTVILKDLQTGRANDVSGHLMVKRREKNYTRSAMEYQYQLQDKGFIVFAPGYRNIV